MKKLFLLVMMSIYTVSSCGWQEDLLLWWRSFWPTYYKNSVIAAAATLDLENFTAYFAIWKAIQKREIDSEMARASTSLIKNELFMRELALVVARANREEKNKKQVKEKFFSNLIANQLDVNEGIDGSVENNGITVIFEGKEDTYDEMPVTPLLVALSNNDSELAEFLAEKLDHCEIKQKSLLEAYVFSAIALRNYPVLKKVWENAATFRNDTELRNKLVRTAFMFCCSPAVGMLYPNFPKMGQMYESFSEEEDPWQWLGKSWCNTKLSYFVQSYPASLPQFFWLTKPFVALKKYKISTTRTAQKMTYEKWVNHVSQEDTRLKNLMSQEKQEIPEKRRFSGIYNCHSYNSLVTNVMADNMADNAIKTDDAINQRIDQWKNYWSQNDAIDFPFLKFRMQLFLRKDSC